MEQNVFFSLLLGLTALSCVHTYKNNPLTAWFMVISLCMGAMITRVSFGWLSIALCLSTYFARQRRALLCLYTAVSLGIYSLSLISAGVTQSWVLVSFCSLAALMPILLYNGKRGPRSPLITFLFYAAYPLHLLVFVLIRAMRIIPPNFLG